jgi:predicted enzyme related to lactoylglutathione lyase
LSDHKHPIVHIELPAANPAESAQFYNKLFGWPSENMPEMDYWSFLTEENHGGGFNKIDSPNAPFQVKPGEVIIYVNTDDLDASLARAEELGGSVVVPRTEIPMMGWFAIFRDPSGNRIGVFEGVEMPQGQEKPEEQAVTV